VSLRFRSSESAPFEPSPSVFMVLRAAATRTFKTFGIACLPAMIATSVGSVAAHTVRSIGTDGNRPGIGRGETGYSGGYRDFLLPGRPDTSGRNQASVAKRAK
jgi:hypothetical protein